MDRILILAGILAGLAAAWLLWQVAKNWLRRGVPVEPQLAASDRPSLLYFSSPDCAPCRLQQAPIVTFLEQELGDRVGFVEYDAGQHPDLAQRYRVLTVPTTVVVAPGGHVVAINYGVAATNRLVRQLEEALSADRVPGPAGRNGR